MNKFDPDIKLVTSNIVFSGGVTRSGKGFLCPIASSFEKFEMFFMSSIAENISYISKLKKLNYKYSSFLIKLIFNEIIYNLNIGRNLNQRKTDYTSITNFKSPKMYHERMKGMEGDPIIKRIVKEKNNYPVMFHDPLINPEILLNSFPNSKIIFVDRHPIELIEEWIKKKYSSDIYENPRNVILTIKYKNKNFPYWSMKKLNEINKGKNIYIKTVYSLSELVFEQKRNLKNLNKKLKKRVLSIKFDNLVQNTDLEIKKITKFLNCKTSKYTKKTILRQKGNRKINLNVREKKKKIILKSLDQDTIKLLKKLEKGYYDKKY